MRAAGSGSDAGERWPSGPLSVCPSEIHARNFTGHLPTVDAAFCASKHPISSCYPGRGIIVGCDAKRRSRNSLRAAFDGMRHRALS